MKYGERPFQVAFVIWLHQVHMWFTSLFSVFRFALLQWALSFKVVVFIWKKEILARNHNVIWLCAFFLLHIMSLSFIFNLHTTLWWSILQTKTLVISTDSSLKEGTCYQNITRGYNYIIKGAKAAHIVVPSSILHCLCLSYSQLI